MIDWVVLINPEAGRHRVGSARVEAALAQHGVAAPVEVVRGRRTMAEAVVEVARSGRAPVVVGGDGTLGLAIGALVEAGLAAEVPVAQLPAGSGCDLLRMFGIPRRLEDAAAHLATDATYRIDVGELTGEWGRRLFVNVAQAGVGAAAVESAMRLPRWMGSARYPAAFASRLPGFPACEIDLTASRSIRQQALAVILANGQFFAGGWNIAPRAMLVDGELDVQVISAAKLEAPRLVPKIVKGLHLGERTVRRRSLDRLELRTEVPWPLEADGDPVGRTPVTVSMLPGAALLKI